MFTKLVLEEKLILVRVIVKRESFKELLRELKWFLPSEVFDFEDLDKDFSKIATKFVRMKDIGKVFAAIGRTEWVAGKEEKKSLSCDVVALTEKDGLEFRIAIDEKGKILTIRFPITRLPEFIEKIFSIECTVAAEAVFPESVDGIARVIPLSRFLKLKKVR